MNVRSAVKWVAALAAVAALVIVGLVFLGAPRNNAFKAPTIPSPNGYEQLVRAGKLVQGESFNPAKATAEELKDYLARNEEALAILRSSLTQQCLVPFDYAQGGKHIVLQAEATMSEMQFLKQDSVLLRSVSRLAELEQRESSEAQALLETIQFCHESSRGGLLIHKLSPNRLEDTSLNRMKDIAPRLTLADCQAITPALEQIHRLAESGPAVVARERVYMRLNAGSFRYGVLHLADIIKRGSIFGAMFRKFEATQAGLERKRAEVLIALASRWHELEKGQPAASPASLVPAYLKEVSQASPPPVPAK